VSPSAPAREFIPVYEPPVTSRNRMIFNREIGTNEGVRILVGQQRIPSWNILGRPEKVKPGTLGHNTQTNNLEYWNGSEWLTLHMR